MSPSAIEWTDETWNPVVGCSKVSPGCDNCYAIDVAHRGLTEAHRGLTIRRPGERPDWTGEVRCLPDRLDQPLRWRRPRRVFVNSMSDLFHPGVPDEFILRVFETMARAERHTFQVLTKRPQRMAAFCGRLAWLDVKRPYGIFAADGGWAPVDMSDATAYLADDPGGGELPLPNVWLGVSIESQRYAWRARHLLDTPAAVRFVSAEPLLGALDLGEYLHDSDCEMFVIDPVDVCTCSEPREHHIDWVIGGGESNHGARPMELQWALDLRRQCAAAGVAFHMKQAGAVLGRQLGMADAKGHDLDRLPAELRVREWPSSVEARA